MIAVYSPKHAMHSPKWYLPDADTRETYLETPDRAEAIVAVLRKRIPPQSFIAANSLLNVEDDIREVHDGELVDFLKANTLERIVTREDAPRVISDADFAVSLSPGTYEAAMSAAAVAITGASQLAAGTENVYCICRPPGHHASRKKMGGFCYFNNTAIAVKYLQRLLSPRVFVLDIDLHHGNGTQDIFYDDRDVFFFSANAAQEYPHKLGGRESKNTISDRIRNFNITGSIMGGHYADMVKEAVALARRHRADFFVVSAGFDTSENELPGMKEGSTFTLNKGDYMQIGDILRKSGFPVLVVQEGGYNSSALGEDVGAFVDGLMARPI